VRVGRGDAALGGGPEVAGVVEGEGDLIAPGIIRVPPGEFVGEVVVAVLLLIGVEVVAVAWIINLVTATRRTRP